MRRKGLFTLSAVLLSACWLLSVPAVMASTFPDFNNTSFWEQTIVGTGISVDVVNNNTLDVTLSKNLTPVGNYYSGGLTTKVPVTGNFDYQVNYNLLNWPITGGPNGVRLTIGFGDGTFGGGVERVSWEHTWSEVYLTDFSGSLSSITTTDTSGTLRIARTGNTVTGSYWSGSDWVVIESYTYSTLGPITFALAAQGPYNSFNPHNQDIKVEFTVKYTGRAPLAALDLLLLN